MKGLTLQNVAAACNGRLFHAEGICDGTSFTAVTTDSRQVIPDALYIPMKGEHADGHDFIPQAFKNGALAVLSEREDAVTDGAAVIVGDTALAIQQIAGLYRGELGLPVVGITGSVGKTGTKEIIAKVLSRKYQVLATAGNFNNNLGLPLTIFRITEEDEVAVLEMGISHFGEMELLGQTARPNIMVFTNIGDCHLEFLKDRDGVYQAKTECLPYLAGEKIVIANGEDPQLLKLEEEEGITTILYGFSPSFRVYADNLLPLGLNGTRCTINIDDRSVDVKIPLPGTHRVLNALAAAATGAAMGLSMEEIKAGIETMETIDGRFKVDVLGDLTLIDDAYNANPNSMRAALSTLAELPGERIAVLGDMGELGENEKELHRELGHFAAALPIAQFVLAGTLAEEIKNGILEARPDAKLTHFENTEAMLSALSEILPKNGTVLVKASHFMGFDRVVAALKAAGTKD